MKKILVSAIIILLVVISGYLLLSDNNSPTIVMDDIEVAEESSLQTYKNSEFGFTFQYPSEWVLSTQNNDLSTGSLLLFTLQDPSAGHKITGQLTCFGELGPSAQITSHGEFRSSEPIEIDRVSTSIFYEQSRGLDSLKFYIPLLGEREDRCGIAFFSFAELIEEYRMMVASFDFVNGLPAFVDVVRKKFQADPPVKG